MASVGTYLDASDNKGRIIMMRNNGHLDQRVPLKVLLCGACMSGNMGGQALYLSMADSLQRLVGPVEVTVLSKYPDDDKRACENMGWTMVPFSTKIQMIYGIPFFLTAWPLRRLGLPWRWLARGPLAHYVNNDVLIDLSGISFTDDRDFTGLIINCLWLTPAVASGIPYVKASQAMGPFSKLVVKIAARFFLSRAVGLVARGATSAKYLRDFFSDRIIHELPDVAFALSPASSIDINEAFLSIGFEPNQSFCVVGPSYVVDMLMKKRNIEISYSEIMASIVEKLLDVSGLPVLLLPHERSHTGSSLDDLNICQETFGFLTMPERVKVLEGYYNASVLKGIIARAEVAIGSRFHFMVAAISAGVPSIAIGWSHKYFEMMNMLGQAYFFINYEELKEDTCLEKIEELWVKRILVRDEIAKYLPEVIGNSLSNARVIQDALLNIRK